ncbi:uncharacterized protein LOC115694351 [Syzygium oleosum]|uniref:uncharacterized protein LOC115694351 n=1 Tax=Syzygium oleosum TaxID=219896 RepID=UPI0011D25EE6|nr:uncharacterized protein LOC115694351 [Syzygium oleosum]
MPPPDGPLPLSSHGDIQNVEPIIKSIPALLAFVSKVTDSLPEPVPQSDDGGVAAEEGKVEAKGGGGGEGGSSWSASSRGSNGTLRNQAEKLRRDLNYIERTLTKFRKLEVDFGSQFENIEEQRRSLDQILSSMAQVPSLRKLSTSNASAHQSDTGFVFNAYYLVDEMPKQDMKKKVLGAPAFEEFFDDLSCVFEDLDPRSKLCLLCFSLFPENAVLRKRLIVNWWTGEGLVDSDDASADDVFKELIAKGLVEPVLKKRKLIGFKMDPLVRFVVIAVAGKVGFFSFNSMGVPTEDFSWSYRACLVRTEGKSSRERLTKNENDLEKLQTTFNVNDPYPDFKLDWFSKLKNLNVLYLSSWQDFAKHHIEVEGT